MNKQIFQGIWKKITAKVKHTYGGLQSMCGKLTTRVKGAFITLPNIWGSIATKCKDFGKALVNTGKAIGKKIKDLYALLLTFLGLVGTKIKGVYSRSLSLGNKIALGVKGAFNRAGKALVNTGKAIGKKIKDLYTLLLTFLGLVGTKIKRVYSRSLSLGNKIALGVKGSFNRAGKALVHTGEVIVAKIKNLYRSLLTLLGLGAIKIKNFYRASIMFSLNLVHKIIEGVKGVFRGFGKVMLSMRASIAMVAKKVYNIVVSTWETLSIKIKNFYSRSLSMRDTITARVQSAFITLPNMRQSIAAKCKYSCETLFNKNILLNPIAYTLYVIIGCVSFVSVGTYFYLRYTQSPEQRMQEQKITAQYDDSAYRELMAKNQNLEQQLTTTQATVHSLQQKIETIQEQHKEEKLAAVDSKIDQAVEQQFKNLKKEIAKQRKEDVHKQAVRQFVERLQSDEG